MQLKPIAVITVLLLVVASLLVAGCTTNTTSNTNQTPSAATSTENTTDKSDLSKDITASFVSSGRAVVKEFTKSTNQYGNVVYTGVVKDNNETTLRPYQHNVTIEMTKNKTDAIQRAREIAAIYQKQGFGLPSNMTDLSIYNKENETVWLGPCEPNNACLGIAGKTFDQWTVVLDYRTKLE
jgi:outer membrane biogenesis lipoprotein LolB